MIPPSMRLTLSAAIILAACYSNEVPPAEDGLGAGVTGGDAIPAVDYPAVARGIVGNRLGVAPGEHVLIAGDARAITFLEDLAIEVRRAGAWPMISVFTDRLAREMYTSVPTERDTDKPTLELAIARTFGTAILVEGSGPQNLLRDVPSERMAARARAAETVNSEISRMARRIIFVGNGLYPSTENATLHGMTPAEFSTMFWSGVNVDPATIAATAVPVKAALAAGTMRITTAAGTDITFTLSGGHVFVSDGAISKDDMAAGPGGGNTWLPAGEVYTRIAPGSANGTIVAERFVLEGEEVTNLRLEVVNGKVTAITAASPIERLLARYDAATAGKDALTVVDIGVNPGMVIPEGSKFQSYMPSGMVTLFTGIDTWAGGSNNSSMGLTLFLSGATVTVNGTPIVADGVLTEWSKM